MQKVRSPTYAENYINLARSVVLNVITDTLQRKEDLTHYILYSDDFMFWLSLANWLDYENVIKDKFSQFKGIDRTIRKKLNTYYRLKGEEMKARKNYESNTNCNHFERNSERNCWRNSRNNGKP